MNVRWWPHTASADAASTRLRCLQIIELMRKQHIDVGLYEPAQPRPGILVLSKRYDAESVAHAVRLRSGGTRVVLDLCDNHFYSHSGDPHWTARADMLKSAVAASDLVIASTQALRKVIETECATRPVIEVIGDAAELPHEPGSPLAHPWAEWVLHRFARRMQRDGTPAGRRLVWFGNHGSPNAQSGMADLLRIKDHVERIAREDGPVSLSVISNSRSRYAKVCHGWGIPTHYLPWHRATVSRALRLHDVAVIPVSDNPFSRCKTNNRVATALLHDLAVVADSIPSYTEFAAYVDLDDWYGGLKRTLANPDDRRERIRLGRQFVLQRYDADTICAQWRGVLASVASEAR